MTIMKCKVRFGVALLICLIILSGCTHWVALEDKDSNWLSHVSSGGKVVVYSRAEGYSASPSPDQVTAQKILSNQEYYLQGIQAALGLSYSDPILIYLYNYDEAAQKIGTSGGGHSIPERCTVYYAYRSDYTPFPAPFITAFNQSGIQAVTRPEVYMGAHEMVHVITHRVLGKPGTKMMSEGYAVAVDGWMRITSSGSEYRGVPIGEWMKTFYQDGMDYLSRPRILSPKQMLTNPSVDELVFYVNAGYFVQFLLCRYGPEEIHPLFNLTSGSFEAAFQGQTGEEFAAMETAYMEYLDVNLSD